MSATSGEDAQKYYQDQFVMVALPEGWTTAVELNGCDGCGKPVLSAHFKNAAKTAGGVIRLQHANKSTGLFVDIEEKWATFAEDELPSIIKKLEMLEEGEEGAFINVDVARIPGLGVALVVSGADILGFLDSLIERAEEEASNREQNEPADE